MTVIASDDSLARSRQGYPPRSAVIAWIFFDWAAQPYFTLITTFVFAPYFATHVASNPAEEATLRRPKRRGSTKRSSLPEDSLRIACVCLAISVCGSQT